ncbi:hypothetical protein QTV44_002542 [Vibrio vulnificus]|nr:hypothetical protein [Vibrio vulnificus]
MSVSIRHRYHYGNVLINSQKVVSGDAMTGNKIPALKKDGSFLYLPFGGVIDDDVSNNKEMMVVKLLNITGFWWNDMAMGSGCYEIPIDHAVKGFCINGRYYLAIRNDKPIHWPHIIPRTNYHTDNVVSMNQWRK